MKIGISLPDYYQEFLKECSDLNDMSITTICGLIVENFLSFNKHAKRVPMFTRQVHLSFVKKNDSGLVPDASFENSMLKPKEEISDEEWNALLAELDSLHPDSED